MPQRSLDGALHSVTLDNATAIDAPRAVDADIKSAKAATWALGVSTYELEAELDKKTALLDRLSSPQSPDKTIADISVNSTHPHYELERLPSDLSILSSEESPRSTRSTRSTRSNRSNGFIRAWEEISQI